VGARRLDLGRKPRERGGAVDQDLDGIAATRRRIARGPEAVTGGLERVLGGLA
jgi:hypothetical protein